MKKFLIGFFLFSAMIILGFILGGIFAQQYLVSINDGMAGAAAVVTMGGAGSFIGIILSVLLVVKLNQKQQLGTTGFVLAASLAVWLYFQFYVLGYSF